MRWSVGGRVGRPLSWWILRPIGSATLTCFPDVHPLGGRVRWWLNVFSAPNATGQGAKPSDRESALSVARTDLARLLRVPVDRDHGFRWKVITQSIRALLDDLNDRPMRGWGTSRRALYEQLDRSALETLPPTPYEFAVWKRCWVGLDYHFEIAKHYYGVPHQLIRQEVEARITVATVEIFFHRGKRVASHRRSVRPHGLPPWPSTCRARTGATVTGPHECIRREAAAIGSDAAALVDVILRSRPHPEQDFCSCIGILGLVKRFGSERVDARLRPRPEPPS
jgi:hypothetical protein